MNVLPNADRAVIPIEKFTKYSLDTTHPTGKDKAHVFREVLGYTADNAQSLIDNIRRNVMNFPTFLNGSNAHGELYECIMRLTGENGREANVLVAWIVRYGEDFPRLTSAYVTEKTLR